MSAPARPTSRILLAPASLKGVLDARSAAALLAEGVQKVAGAEPTPMPVADGGEGTAEVIALARGGTWHEATVRDPLGRPVLARFALLPDGTGVVDCAEAIGLPRLLPAERDPLHTSSAGLGDLLLAALDAGAQTLLVGLGGSATVDGGVGMREVVGERLAGVAVTAACDVANPLLGPRGAAQAFGPQKGADPDTVDELERRLARLPDLAPFADLRGAGAAGGLGAALASLGATLAPGAALVLEVLGAHDAIAAADLVITGEGRVDRTTGEGKAPGAVARLARDLGVRCVVFGGTVADAPDDLETVALSGDPERVAADLRAVGAMLASQVLGTDARRPRAH